MNDHHTAAHPDDATLFDFVDGALDAARAGDVRDHIASCAMCAELVAAASAGAPLRVGNAVEPMPRAHADALHAAVGDAWRELHPGSAGATTPDAISVESLPDPLAMPSVRTPAPRSVGSRWSRRLVPALAFVALAVLAGTSVFLTGDDHPGGGSSTSPPAVATDTSTAGSNAKSADQEAAEAPQVTPDVGDASSGASAGAASTDGGLGAAPTATAPPSKTLPDGTSTGTDEATSSPIDGVATPEHVLPAGVICMATRDPSQLQLPDSRIPEQIVEGPLGIYVVCG